jgi:hypothetical protein
MSEGPKPTGDGRDPDAGGVGPVTAPPLHNPDGQGTPVSYIADG